MAKANKILIIDDDPELRDALTEQLSLHEEFEAVAVENGFFLLHCGEFFASKNLKLDTCLFGLTAC